MYGAHIWFWPTLNICAPVSHLQYPLLMAHRERVADLPDIKQYLESPRRPAQVSAKGEHGAENILVTFGHTLS